MLQIEVDFLNNIYWESDSNRHLRRLFFAFLHGINRSTICDHSDVTL